MFHYSIAPFLEIQEQENTVLLGIERRILRDKSNPLSLPSTRFKKLFRLSKDAFYFVLETVSKKFNRRNVLSIPPIIKLAATLRFLAEGNYQQGVGTDFNVCMAQSTVSAVLNETLNILEEELCDKVISFKQSADEKREEKMYCFKKYGIPGVIGYIDGTHVAIISPSIDEEHYFNRKGFHSINAMIICDHSLKLLSVNASYGGSCHDSFIWSRSQEKKYLENLKSSQGEKSWLLGDSGYPLEPWLITPYRNAANESLELRFNTKHASARAVIERLNGVLKGRFRCLLKASELHYKPKKAVKIINVCAMLHNICIKYKVNFEEDLVIDDAHFNADLNLTPSLTNNIYREANDIRDQIKIQL